MQGGGPPLVAPSATIQESVHIIIKPYWLEKAFKHLHFAFDLGKQFANKSLKFDSVLAQMEANLKYVVFLAHSLFYLGAWQPT